MIMLLAFAINSGLVAAETTEKQRPGMIERHDQDGDNRLSSDEFPGPDEHFNHIDTDGDGYISETEAQNAPRPGRNGKKEGGVPGGFYQDDENGDGVVSQSEFSGPEDHFDKLDLDGDGYIQESEAAQGPPGKPRRNRSDQ